MFILKGDRPFAVSLDLAPGVVIPWFFWNTALLYLTLGWLSGVFVPDAFFAASEFSISIGAVLSNLAFFPDLLVCTGQITVKMLAVLVLLDVLLPPPLLVGSLVDPLWECSVVYFLGVCVWWVHCSHSFESGF